MFVSNRIITLTNDCRETEKVTNLPEYWRMIDDTIKLAADNVRQL